MALVDHGLDAGGTAVLVRDDQGRELRRTLQVEGLNEGDASEALERMGLHLWNPPIPPVVDRLREDSAAEHAGLQPGDRIIEADGEPIPDWRAWAEYVRARPEVAIRVLVERGDHDLVLTVIPSRQATEAGEIGLIGAYARVPEDLQQQMSVVIRYGPLGAIAAGAERTWDMSLFTLRMLGRMLVGQASLENLSGPITIAQFAGQTVSAGLTSFLAFLALISISLGVLNLLPVTVLDGGHLLYYLIEAVRGSPVSEAVQAVGQRVGLTILLMLMGLAFFNDISRLFGS